MALAEQLGSPSEVIMTTPAVTFDDITNAEWIFDPELLEHFNGNTVYPRIVIGNMNVQIKFTTTDIRAFTMLIKGMRVAGVQVKFKATNTDINATTGALTAVAGDISFTVSDMIIDEPITVTNDASKKAAEYTVSCKAILTSAGIAPTLTFDLALGGA